MFKVQGSRFKNRRGFNIEHRTLNGLLLSALCSMLQSEHSERAPCCFERSEEK